MTRRRHVWHFHMTQLPANKRNQPIGVEFRRPLDHGEKMKRVIIVNDHMQKGYRYELVAPAGRNFHPDFRPELTPAQMLALGVFCGKYMTDTRKEFPASWFTRAKLSPGHRDCSSNYFGVDASQPPSVWRKKG
jgi:hypothetical protein